MNRIHGHFRLPAAATLALLATAFVMSGCDLTAMNDNPNAPTEPTLPYLLTNAETSFASEYWGRFTLGNFANLYAQYWSRTQYTQDSRYQEAQGRSSGMWDDYYLMLSDLQEFIHTVKADSGLASKYGDPQAQIAMANTLQVYIFQLMTDIWGPLPFTEALAGRENFTPAYASQEQIYTALIDSISAAIAGLPESGTAQGGADIIFGGALKKWNAFATSLKMRLAIRMAEAKPDLAAQAFEEAFTGTTLDEIDANALIPFLSEQPYVNPIYETYIVDERDDWSVSATLLSLMNKWKDPRRSAYAQLSPGSDYTGFPYGLPPSQATAIWDNGTGDFSRPSKRVAYTATAPAILLTASEVLFMKAEAAQRGWISGSAAAFYERAIRASMNYWGVEDEAAIDAYIAKVPYDPAHWKQVIGVQKWIALYMQGMQGWSVFRRLDFDGVFALPPGNPGGSDFGKHFPVRLPYPNAAANLNGKNWEKAKEILGGEDDQGTPLWWDGPAAGQPKGE